MEIVGGIGMFALIITVVLSLIWRSAFLKRTRLQHGQDDRYLKLVERSEEQQAKVLEQLQALNARVTRIETGTASIEETLKVVE
ncbi:hypothetical protein LO763_04805 [Glycomyces sp. A-F 0318]|uniref:hypothetical protein n=1 Tax=Glycomyces amatae TaxID=2881355 RepID=UPI001E4D284E|nr:hypothetical protein [Glycomyces amatae]MCD0442945.1 hypothetical protein [Glycomyces amatae]